MSKDADTLTEIMRAAIAACQPKRCLPIHLPPIPENGRIIVLGAGKAAAEMAAITEKTYIERGLDPNSGRLLGSVATRHGYAVQTAIINVEEAGHPIPDNASLNAANTALRLAAKATSDDLVLVLLSGGASAIWCAPVPSVTLEQKGDVTRKLLHAGANIVEINAVRKHLSSIKGGRLVKAANGAHILTLSISDVSGDIQSAIGSGPTTGDETTLRDARAALDKYEISVGANIKNALCDEANETPDQNDAVFQNTTYRIIASARHAMDAAAHKAEQLGYKNEILGDAIEGEAREIGRAHAHLALEKLHAQWRGVLISGGELTVKVTGDGSGGPNQEYALSMLMELQGCKGITALAADSDGSDGGKGAKYDPAGAFITPDTLNKAKALNLNPAIFLANNDSSSFFYKLNRHIVTGPTQTNVNDIRIILIDP